MLALQEDLYLKEKPQYLAVLHSTYIFLDAVTIHRTTDKTYVRIASEFSKSKVIWEIWNYEMRSLSYSNTQTKWDAY